MDIFEFSGRSQKRIDTDNGEQEISGIQGGFFLRWKRGGKPPNWKEILEIITALITAIAFSAGAALLYKWLSKWVDGTL